MLGLPWAGGERPYRPRGGVIFGREVATLFGQEEDARKERRCRDLSLALLLSERASNFPQLALSRPLATHGAAACIKETRDMCPAPIHAL